MSRFLPLVRSVGLVLKAGRLLLHTDLVKQITDLIREAARFANLDAQERRAYVLEHVLRLLRAHGIVLPDRMVSLVVELLYHLFREDEPHASAAKPVDWTTKKAG